LAVAFQSAIAARQKTAGKFGADPPTLRFGGQVGEKRRR